MFSFDFKKRIRYSETDKMGYLYYGNYAALYEIGRVETIRSLGLTYRELEDDLQIMMPVLAMESRYLSPAYYDDTITIRTILKEMPGKMVVFHHEIMNDAGDILNKGIVKLFFVDRKTNKRVSAPPYITDPLNPYFV